MGEWSKFWSSIDAMKREHDKTRETVNRRRGWKFKGCEVFGIKTRWRAEYREPGYAAPTQVEKPTSAELLAEVARISVLCPKCFHKLTRCGPKGCSINVHGEKCSCTHNKSDAVASNKSDAAAREGA